MCGPQSPTECVVPKYDREASKRRRTWFNSGSRAVTKKKWKCTLTRETITNIFHYIRSTAALNIATVQH